MTRVYICATLFALFAAPLLRAQDTTAPSGEQFVRGMTVSFPGTQALRFRILSEPLPDLGQGGPVTELQLGPPLDLWILGPDENRMPVEGARLIDPTGTIIPPREPGHWRIDRPPLGYLTLQVPAVGGPWRLWSAFHPFMLRLAQPVTVIVGKQPGAVFLHPSGARLDFTKAGEATITPGEGAQWVAFAPWDRFEPSLPHVEIKGETTLGPGDRLRLRAAVSDPDGDIERITWRLPGDRTASGTELDIAIPDLAAFTVSVEVTDREGNTASTEVMVDPPAPHEVDLPGIIFIQAEDFVSQEGGQVEVTDRGHNVGKMITKWHHDLGHTLEWRFTVDKPGRYVIYARYGSGGKDPHRALTIDGAPPAPAFEDIAFAPTGGYGRAAGEWRVVRLGPPVELQAGRHTLRMTNLGDGMALDYLALVPLAPEE